MADVWRKAKRLVGSCADESFDDSVLGYGESMRRIGVGCGFALALYLIGDCTMVDGECSILYMSITPYLSSEAESVTVQRPLLRDAREC